VWPNIVVFNKPVSQLLVKVVNIFSINIPHIDKVFLYSPVKPLKYGIIFGSSDPGIPLGQGKLLAGYGKVFGKLRAIIVMNVYNSLVC